MQTLCIIQLLFVYSHNISSLFHKQTKFKPHQLNYQPFIPYAEIQKNIVSHSDCSGMYHRYVRSHTSGKDKRRRPGHTPPGSHRSQSHDSRHTDLRHSEAPAAGDAPAEGGPHRTADESAATRI